MKFLLFFLLLFATSCQEWINSGVVTEKYYKPQKSTTTISQDGKKITTTHSREKYILTIRGYDSKHEQVYQSTEVPKDTYLIYHVGDSFIINRK
jgi:hypothetical protein